MASSGDITSSRINDMIDKIVKINGYALCHITAGEKDFDINYYSTNEGIISSGSEVFKNSVLNYIDEDVFVNMLMNCGVENVKEFQKYRKLVRAQINELPDNITMFENELCTIREQLVNVIRGNVQTLSDYHFNYVNDMFHKRSTGRSIIINGKDIELKKSQKDFIVSAMKKIMFS